MDNRNQERVELACVTGSSAYQGFGMISEYIEYAKKQGMKALAITDYSSMTAFPEAYERVSMADMEDFKVIYGCSVDIYDPDVDNAELIRVYVLIRNEEGRSSFYKLYSDAARHCLDKRTGSPCFILPNLLDISDDLLIGLADPRAKTSFVPDYVALDCNEPEDVIREKLDICSKNNWLPVVVSNPHYLSKDSTLSYKVLHELDDEEIPDKHYMTTQEVLDKIAYLGEATAYELVVTNSNEIANRCEHIAYICNERDLLQETDGDIRLKKLCYKALLEKYEVVTDEIKDRLNWELNRIRELSCESIFLNLYDIISRLDIKPYEIGSRGCVCDCLVAYLLGITTIDPIKYNLPAEFFFRWEVDQGKNYVPDIDLNVRNERLWKLVVNEYEKLGCVESIVIPATDIVMNEREINRRIDNYIEKNNVMISDMERNKIVYDLSETVVKRGRHPGGILVFPEGQMANDVMPLSNIGSSKYPVMASGFDYRDVLEDVLKIDFLLHETPEILSRLVEMTGVDIEIVRDDDPDVLAMFMADNKGNYACTGIPEFSQDFNLEVLRKAGPRSFRELATFFGYLHGTGVWSDNAENLIEDGIADISQIPGGREDIYSYLVSKGIDDETAYGITEDIRRGRVARAYINKSKGMPDRFYAILDRWEQYKDIMREHDVPEWYISYLEKIRYMFPKAHALDYLKKSWQIAWFKLHYPLEYYKVMIDVKYRDVDFSTLSPDTIESLRIDGRDMDFEEIEDNLDRYNAYHFFKQFFTEEYRIILDENVKVTEFTCRILQKERALIINKHNK